MEKILVGSLNEEIRNGFLVSEKRKAVWNVELCLLKRLDEVCKKYNLRYWLDGGSLLGAIRHNGFIPWDDDIDVVMPRKDYDKLSEISKLDYYSPEARKEKEEELAHLRTEYTRTGDKLDKYNYLEEAKQEVRKFFEKFKIHLTI